MELIGAVDLLGGRARRLVRGDYERVIGAEADPIGLARSLAIAGLRRLHVVDLDGARAGRPVQREIAGRLCEEVRQVARGVRVEAGGGLRDVEAVAGLFDAGVDEVILGSSAIADPRFLARAARSWPGRVGAALDLRDGRLAVAGWTREAAAEPFALASRLLEAGASRLVVTDVTRDGTGSGPNLALLSEFRRRLPDTVLVAAGGIATPADLAALARLGMDGAIVGRALLEGTLDVAEAMAACTPEVVA